MNDQPTQKNTFEDEVFNKIKTKNIRMKTRMHFLLSNFLVLLVAIVTFCVSALCLSYIFYSIGASDQIFLLGFGLSGIRLFFILFPWGIFIVDIALIIILNMLLNRFKLAYRKPFITIFLSIFILTVLGGLVIESTHVHDSIMEKIEEGHFPIVGGFYENLRKSLPDQGIFKGKIVAVSAATIIVMHNDGDHDADDWTQVIVATTAQTAGLQTGDNVFVYAHPVNGVMTAYGVRKIDTFK